MKLSDLISNTKKVKVVYMVGEQEFPIEIVYRTQAVTIPLLRALQEAESDEQMIQQIVKLVQRWDLQDDDGKELPLDEESLQQSEIPVTLLAKIISSIYADQAQSNEIKKA